MRFVVWTISLSLRLTFCRTMNLSWEMCTAILQSLREINQTFLGGFATIWERFVFFGNFFHDSSSSFVDHLRICWGCIRLRIGKHWPLSDGRGPHCSLEMHRLRNWGRILPYFQFIYERKGVCCADLQLEASFIYFTTSLRPLECTAIDAEG